MNRFIMITCLACSLALGTLSLGGCGTVSGIGQDVRETGDVITGTPIHEAYHQDARDF